VGYRRTDGRRNRKQKGGGEMRNGLNKKIKTGKMPAVIISIVLFCGAALYGLDTTWGDSLTDGVRESASTGMYTPARYAFDDDEATYWALGSGETKGWADRYWDSVHYIDGADIVLDTGADTTVRIYYEEDGTRIPVAGGIIRGAVSGSVSLRFTEDLRSTKNMLVTVEGKDAADAKIYTVTWKEQADTIRYGKILPESYSFNQKEYINLKPSRLWDGIISETWYEPVWSIPWEVQQAPFKTKVTDVFAAAMGNPSKDGEIIWKLDGTYTVETLKVYCSETWRSIAFEFWDGTAWRGKQIFRGNFRTGWQRLDISGGIPTNRIRITFPGGWELARYINQIEVWGEGTPHAAVRSPVYSGKDSRGRYTFSMADPAGKQYEAEYIVSGTDGDSISGSINGKSYTVSPSAYIGTESVYTKKISRDEEKAGTQFFDVDTGGAELEGIVLRGTHDDGSIQLGAHYSDGFTGAPVKTEEKAASEKTWKLDRQYELEKIRVYADGLKNLSLYVQGNRWNTKSLQYDERGFWDADLHGLAADTVTLVSDADFLCNEVQLYGSPLSDKTVSLELWWPDESVLITGQGRSGDCLIGWTGSCLTKPVINGQYYPRQMGNVFWMPLNQMETIAGTVERYTVKGTLGNNAAVKTITARMESGNALFSLDDSSCEYTKGGYVSVSGTVTLSNTRCFIGAKEVEITDGRFTGTAAVHEGYQVLEVTLWDKSLRHELAAAEKPVYRAAGNVQLTIDEPRGSIWTQRSSMTVSGRAGNGDGLSVTVNGTAVPLKDDRYTLDVPLEEGVQTVRVCVTDNMGRMNEHQITVQRDSTEPAITLLTPSEGQYIARSDVEFKADGHTDEFLWWQFNNGQWEEGTGYIEKKICTLADGFYTYTVRAEDRCGNISNTERVRFCVDVTPPQAFEIKSDVDGWTNNTSPVLTFASEDSTSGIDHYDYKIDDGIWTETASPLRLPELKDGIRTVTVRAVDRAGNITEAEQEEYIDTSNPPEPQNVRPVPSGDSITMKWTGIDDGESYQSYRIERKPAWSDGVRELTGRTYGANTYTDTDVVKEQLVYYQVWAVDRAGNESPKSAWCEAQAGVATVGIADKGNTVVEYKNVTLTVPEGATAADIVKVQINEVPLNSISVQPVQPLVSGIYSVTEVRQKGEKTEITNHADLKKDAVLEIAYSPEKIPAGYTESDLKPFYYDDLWGCWVPAENGHVDTARHVMLFPTNHFTDFSVQATKEEVLTPQQMREGAYSPFKSNIGPGEVLVSNDGVVSTRFTELALPGKNGLDFAVQRVYSTTRAQKDGKTAGGSDSNGSSGIKIDGESSWKIAEGWKMNMPYLAWNGSQLWMADPDGNTVSLAQMILKDTVEDGDNLTLVMENHEYTDETIEFSFRKKVHYLFGFITWIPLGSTYSYKGAVLYQSGGRKVTFDSKGRVTKMTGETGKNSISFAYQSGGITATDSMGRIITFGYTSGKISSVSVRGGVSISYTTEDGKLIRAEDAGGRVWTYGYTAEELKSTTELKNPPDGYEQPEPKTRTVQALSSVSGPGIGTTTIAYDKTGDLTFCDTIQSNKDSYDWDITYKKLQAVSRSVAVSSEGKAVRTTSYTFTISGATENQFVTQSEVIDDGRIVSTLKFKYAKKNRPRLSEAPEALEAALNLRSVAQSTNTTELQVYETGITRQEKESGKIIDSGTITLNSTLMRTAERRSAKAAGNGVVDLYDYDGYGNVTEEHHTYTTDGRTSGTAVSRTFLPPSAGYRTNLTSSVTTESTGIVSSGKTIPTKVTESYAYNAYGQMTAKTTAGGTWNYEYTDSDGQLAETTSPAGQVTAYAYDYGSDSYTVTKSGLSVRNVSGADGSSTIKTTQKFNLLTGKLVSDTDADGNTAVYDYDSLGRLTGQHKDGGMSTVSVAYDDTKLTSTVTNEKGGVTVNTYDNLGRLVSIIKTNDTVLPERLSDGSDTITTTFCYDGYDDLTSMQGPVSSHETYKLSDIITKYEYDSRGRVTAVTNPDETKKVYAYADDTNTVTVTDETGRKTRQQTDWLGNIIENGAYKGSGSWISRKTYYDGSGRVLESVDGNGSSTTTRYNSMGLEAVVTKPAVSVIENGSTKDVQPTVTKEYNADGYLSSITTGYGDATTTTTYTVNGLGETIQSRTPVGNSMYIEEKEYNGRGSVIKETSGYEGAAEDNRHTKKWTYDWKGNVLTQTDEAGQVTSYAYDQAGNRTNITDPRENNTAYTGEFFLRMDYDKFNRLVKAWTPHAEKRENPGAADILIAYDGRGNVLKRSDPEGAVTVYTYTKRNSPETKTLDGYVTSYTYDAAGREIQVTGPDGSIRLTTYDDVGRVLKVRSGENDPGVRYTYNDNGTVTQKVDQNGKATAYTYNTMNLETSEKVKDNGTVLKDLEKAYDALGRLVQQTDGTGNERTYTYDTLNRVTAETTPTGSKLTYVYDAWGNVVNYTDADGTVFTRAYTKTNKLKDETAQNGSRTETTSYEYDEAGTVKSVTNGSTTMYYNMKDGTYQSNAYDLVTSMNWSATGLTMQYGYDSLNRLTTVTTPGGKNTEYSYNTNGQVTGMSGWLDGTIAYENALMKQYTLINGVTKNYTYDDYKRISGITYDAAGNTTAGYTYGYDNVSNVKTKQVHGAASANVYTYDGINQLLTSSESGSFRKTPDAINPSFAETDRDYTGEAEPAYTDTLPVSVTLDAEGKSLSYDMESIKRVNRVELYPESSTHRVKERNIRIFYKTGTAGSGWTQVTGWNFSKDNKNGSLSFTFKEAVEARYIKVVTDWDDRNTDNESIENYATFKGTPRNLLRVWTLSSNLAETYGYDTAGNRVSLTTGDVSGNMSYTYTYYANTNNGNSTRVKYDGRWYYTYDANGNRTARGKSAAVSGNNVTIDTAAEYWTYTWDLHNRLTAVKQYNAPDNGTCASVSYTYDALNYRIERTGSDGTTVYAYGRSGAVTYQKTTGTSGTTVRSYAYLNNEVVGWTDTDAAGTESKKYAVTDMLGSVTKVLDKTGSVVWSSEYTAFGTIAGTVTDAAAFSGMFTGKDIDAETGLTYHWNRWRSEDGTCFISEDPARDGVNWYGYCGNNPMTYSDPAGLAPYKNGVYDGPYDPDHQAPEVTYGPEYKSGTPSESAHPSAPTVETPDVTVSPLDYDGDEQTSDADIDGKVDFDEKKGIITCDLTNREAMQAASTQFVLNEKRGYSKCIAIDPNTGNKIIFNNANEMVDFVDSNLSGGAPNYEEILSDLTTALSLGYIDFDIAGYSKYAKGLNNITTGLSGVTTTIDAYQFFVKNKDIDTGSDVAIDIVGFMGKGGLVASLWLGVMKKGIDIWASSMAEFSVGFEAAYKNNMIDEAYKEMR
jgi:RHS repeat-associated protein